MPALMVYLSWGLAKKWPRLESGIQCRWLFPRRTGCTPSFFVSTRLDTRIIFPLMLSDDWQSWAIPSNRFICLLSLFWSKSIFVIEICTDVVHYCVIIDVFIKEKKVVILTWRVLKYFCLVVLSNYNIVFSLINPFLLAAIDVLYVLCIQRCLNSSFQCMFLFSCHYLFRWLIHLSNISFHIYYLTKLIFQS